MIFSNLAVTHHANLIDQKDEKFESLFNVVNENTNSPKFVFFHLMNTHEPFVFDENCEYLKNPSYLLAKDNKQGFFNTQLCKQ